MELSHLLDQWILETGEHGRRWVERGVGEGSGGEKGKVNIQTLLFSVFRRVGMGENIKILCRAGD
jgi:hypothetical protein